MKKVSAPRLKSVRELRREKLINVACAVLAIGAFLLVWQLASMYSKRARFIPSPFVVIPKFFQSFTQPIGPKKLMGHIVASLLRVLSGFAAAAVVGVILGILAGRSRVMRAIINPFIEILRPIPGIAWIPISILWFGPGEVSKVFILFIATFTLIAVNTFAGASAVDPQLIGAARMLGASKLRVFFTVILPYCVPHIFTGLQTGLTVAWMTVVAAEMIRSEFGVGWIIDSGYNSYNMAQVMVGILTIGLIGFALANGLRLLERRLCAWKKS